MEVRIRLQKAGKAANKAYNWRVVAMSRKEGRDGRTLDILGYYDPAKKSYFSLKKEKIAAWVSKGAQLSDTVRSLMKKVK
ncbi:MAG: 30S ribosomal protein S16 [Candidatus Omnitrophica bacterium]|nr:30S ribosomal protein S16 [Candidatus Omnitrophota bacterium]MDE2008825.1 30S ribosomal protein S16 [Candidatus Omnitrophota bacterium]MDE2213612.1 30S ribosomal protein S16 [Candidatus Omnitrophota bacterium]MDE2230487.1 30S ribosomal protein S16 [Candidatus Omnitrophota bacterium]